MAFGHISCPADAELPVPGHLDERPDILRTLEAHVILHVFTVGVSAACFFGTDLLLAMQQLSLLLLLLLSEWCGSCEDTRQAFRTTSLAPLRTHRTACNTKHKEVCGFSCTSQIAVGMPSVVVVAPTASGFSSLISVIVQRLLRPSARTGVCQLDVRALPADLRVRPACLNLDCMTNGIPGVNTA